MKILHCQMKRLVIIIWVYAVYLQIFSVPKKSSRMVTSAVKDGGAKRLFFSTVSPEHLEIFCVWHEKAPLNQTGSDWMQYIPLFLYSFRWNIEVSYYEQKTFWSLCSYMAELLTPSIAYAYNEKAKALPYNGMQDIGERRRLRQDLQERCGITELEAINIINGFHIDTYCMKYLRKAREAAEGTPEPTKKKRRR